MSDEARPNSPMDLIINHINQLVDGGYRVEFRQTEGRPEIYIYAFGSSAAIQPAFNRTADGQVFEADFVASVLSEAVETVPGTLNPLETYQQRATVRMLDLMRQINRFVELGYRVEFRKDVDGPHISTYLFDFEEPGKPDHILGDGKANSDYFENIGVDSILASILLKAEKLVPPQPRWLSNRPYLLKFGILEVEAAEKPSLHGDGSYHFPVHMSSTTRSRLEEKMLEMQHALPATMKLDGESKTGHIVEVQDWTSGNGWVAVFRPN